MSIYVYNIMLLIQFQGWNCNKKWIKITQEIAKHRKQ